MKDKEGGRRRDIMMEAKKQGRHTHRYTKTKGGSGEGEERMMTRKFRLSQSNTSI